jgi:hypothetical protein
LTSTYKSKKGNDNDSDDISSDESSDIYNILEGGDKTKGRDWQKTVELKDRRARMFDILDDEEEMLVTNTIEKMKKERLMKEFKNLFYKSREIKEVMSEYAELNLKLQEEMKERDKDMRKLAGQLKEKKVELKRVIKRAEGDKDNLDRATEVIRVLEEDNYKLRTLSENYSRRLGDVGLKLQAVESKENEHDDQVEELRHQLLVQKEQLLMSLENLERSKYVYNYTYIYIYIYTCIYNLYYLKAWGVKGNIISNSFK